MGRGIYNKLDRVSASKRPPSSETGKFTGGLYRWQVQAGTGGRYRRQSCSRGCQVVVVVVLGVVVVDVVEVLWWSGLSGGVLWR